MARGRRRAVCFSNAGALRARGSFAYDVLRPQHPGVAALGMYFHEGRLGLLYAPLLFDRAEPYTHVSWEQFVELVRLRHGIALAGLRTRV
jgi:hypothetical protein